MSSFEILNHAKWECEFHVVFIPKYRKKVIYGHIRKEWGPILRDLAKRMETKIEEGHLMPDHVHRGCPRVLSLNFLVSARNFEFPCG
jgi:putative transposase